MSEYIDTVNVSYNDESYQLHIIGDLKIDPFDDELFVGVVESPTDKYFIIPLSKYDSGGPDTLDKSLDSDQCIICAADTELSVSFIINEPYDPTRDDFSDYFEVTTQDIETVCAEFITAFKSTIYSYKTDPEVITAHTL